MADLKKTHAEIRRDKKQKAREHIASMIHRHPTKIVRQQVCKDTGLQPAVVNDIIRSERKKALMYKPLISGASQGS